MTGRTADSDTRDDPDESEALLLDVVTPSGRWAVAALVDVPLHRLAAALAQLLGADRAPGYDLVGDQHQCWDQAKTLGDLDIAPATVVRLVPRAQRPDG